MDSLSAVGLSMPVPAFTLMVTLYNLQFSNAGWWCSPCRWCPDRLRCRYPPLFSSQWREQVSKSETSAQVKHSEIMNQTIIIAVLSSHQRAIPGLFQILLYLGVIGRIAHQGIAATALAPASPSVVSAALEPSQLNRACV